MRLIGGNLEQPEVETEPRGEGLRTGRVEVDEKGVTSPFASSMFARAVRVKGVVALFAPVGICTVKLAVKVTMATSCGFSAVEGVVVRVQMVKGRRRSEN